MVAAITIILAAYFWVSLKKPHWGYGLLLAALPAYLIRLQVFSVPTTFLELMVGVFLLSVLLTHYNRASLEKIQRLGRLNWLAAAFLLAAVISTVVSPEPIKALGQLKAFFVEPVLLFYAAIVIFKNQQEFLLALRLIFASALAISVFAFFQYWTHVLLPHRFWGYGLEIKRVTSFFEYPNALALYLAPLFALFFTLRTRGIILLGKGTDVIGVLVLFGALVLTYSRGGLVAAAAVLVIMMLKQGRVSMKKWGLWAAVAAIIMLPLLLGRFNNTFRDGASSERLQLYQMAWNKLMESPILGNGLYGFRTTLVNSDYSGEILNYPHNIILNFWLETGLLGMLAAGFLILSSMRTYAHKPNPLRLAAAMFLVAVFVHGLVDAPYFKNDLSILFWSILAMSHIKDPT